VVGVTSEPSDVRSPDVEPPLRLRPRFSLLWQGLVACIVFLSPIFVALYLISGPTGGWPTVLAVQIAASVAVFVGCARFFLVSIWVSAASLGERGFFSPKREFPLTQVAQVVRARVFRHGSEEVDQLFVCDAEGRCMVRLRGQFWSSRDMDALTEALGVPVNVLAEVVTLRELARDHPRLAYWFERF
jgi:hypothetical protein